MALTNKRQAFINEYLKDCNATQAAIRAGYAPNAARVTASRLLSNANISGEIARRLAEKSMSADEVIQRLTEQARGDIGDFIDIESMSYRVNLAKAKELGLTHLIHKVRERTVMTSNRQGEETETHTIEFELYDAQAALALLARYHKLFANPEDVPAQSVEIHVMYDERNEVE